MFLRRGLQLMLSIFNYTDYRKFLLDLFAEKKAHNPSFTYRHLAAEAGYKSAGFFTQVLQGKTNLSDEMTRKLCRAFSLAKREARYFGWMVRFNQADAHDQKKEYYRRMASFKKARVKTIDPVLYDFYDKWYYSAIRAAIQYVRFTGSEYAELAKIVVPSITAGEAKRAIEVLLSLGLIVRGETGRFALTEKHISTGLDTDSVVINNFVLNTFEIAKEALYRFPKDLRSFSSLTLGVSPQGYARIKERCDVFRRELVEIVRADRNIDRVYQVNMQLFPLTTADTAGDK